MNNSVPKNLKYSKTHEWVRREEDDVVTIGITDHAQRMLGDVVYIDLPELEDDFEEKEECALLESVKTAAGVFAPLSGEVTEINESLFTNPGAVNKDPYGEGWLFRMRPFDNDKVMSHLLNADQYSKQVASEAH